MLRAHQIMISQTVGGEDHWTIIRLQDKHEAADGTFIRGTWRHTDKSYNDQEIKFTGDNPEYLYWEWRGNAKGGDFSIGSKMGRASHKAGEDEYFQILITLLFCKRTAGGTFKIASVLNEGAGKLTYNANPHFEKGDITYTIVAY